MTINGDTVEYSADAQDVTASGNVEIISGDSKLTCQKITVNMQTKVGEATGRVRLEDGKGIIEGEKIIYNFQNKTGTIIDAQFRANPFFGRARTVDRESENEFVAHYGYFTTCSFDRPHYRIGSKQINVMPKQLIQTKDDCLYIGPFPVAQISRFNKMFDKPVMHVSVLPGKRKDWGPFLLSEWTYNINNYLDGRFYMDYRDNLGLAEGLGLNYLNTPVGSGDFKYYYTNESSRNYSDTSTIDFKTTYQRYLLRLRQKWDIDNQTNLVTQFYKIGDDKRKFVDQTSSFLQEYFYREFEKDAQPPSYALFHHSFPYSSIDILLDKRVNHWFSSVDKLPEVKYTLSSLQVGSTPFYFENKTTFDTFNKKLTFPPDDDITVSRLDAVNKLSLPMKVAFLWVNPFVQDEQTVYDKGVNDATLLIRTVFSSGVDVSTKFYHVFDVKNDFLGMELNGLRHVITPTVGYAYNHSPTIPASNLYQIDGVDALTSSNRATLELSNKLQTKRQGISIDLVDFLVTTSYAFQPQFVSGNKTGGSFQDVLFKLKLLPYAWMRMEGDVTYQHSGVTSAENFNKFSLANYDLDFDFGAGYSFGIGQRYQRKGQNQVTGSFKWQINPKWKVSVYQRYNLKPFISTGVEVPQSSLEQEYVITRNLHCWDVELSFNTKRYDGSSIFLIFRLKAFPENEFGYNQSYAKPKSGSVKPGIIN